ncbi:hypothetical protein [Gluconobacter albidus]|uniref:hypothetical protein n=1 Tax=Gluconobacter albidus TaxID=318683 RepID=UPI000AE57415|nr:hypothetical protein [Gluconobacter albidus]
MILNQRIEKPIRVKILHYAAKTLGLHVKIDSGFPLGKDKPVDKIITIKYDGNDQDDG